MFEKISKLKNFGIFRDFSWSGDTPDFVRFNLIYGWNRSGKTTLSKVFAACEKRTTDFKVYPRNGEFEIKVQGGQTVNHNNCRYSAYHVRVFNRDFVEENVFFDPEEVRANPIVYVGKEDIKSREELQELRERESSLENEYNAAKAVLGEKRKKEDLFRTRVAKQIKDTVGNLKVSDKYRTYDKSDIKREIDKTGIENFLELSPEDHEKQKNLIGSKQPETLRLLHEYSFDLSYEGRRLRGFSEISKEISALLARNVVSQTIERLKDDDKINRWAERGFHLHKSRNEEKKCLFCQNELKPGFLESLSRHFSDDYEKLQRDIDSFIHELTGLKKEKISGENQKLSSRLQNQYKDKAEDLNDVISRVNDWIGRAEEKLKEKRGNPLLTVEPVECPEDFARLCDEAVKALNSVKEEHNSESRNHEQSVREAKGKLESHIIASAIREERYSEISSDLSLSAENMKEIQGALNPLREKISELEKKASDIGAAITEINQHLEEFFGREEIALELDSSKKGYVIRRNGEVAPCLSEGEKNAIAFSYFIVKTREEGFKIEEGIIVIDDPVSSFDSNFTYHCFSLVKNKFKDARQLILLTHNFEFFSLARYWFHRKNKKTENRNRANGKSGKTLPCEFFMIRNEIRNEHRSALISPLDRTLREFSSDYHFLFSELKRFLEKTGDDYAASYRIGNIARRFLEIYANFKIPTTGDLGSKLDQICGDCVSETEKDRLYRLIQEFSHGGDPGSAIEHKDRSEIESGIGILMKVVKGSDKKHFESLKKSIGHQI